MPLVAYRWATGLQGRDVVGPAPADVMPATASTCADPISIPGGRDASNGINLGGRDASNGINLGGRDASNGINLGGRDLVPCARDLLPPTAGAIMDR